MGASLKTAIHPDDSLHQSPIGASLVCMAVGCGGRVDVEGFVSSLASFDVSAPGDDEVKALVLASERLSNAVHAFSASLLEELDRREVWALDGARSGPGWAAPRTGTAKAALQHRAGVGRGLRLLPSAQRPARAGLLSPAHLAALAGCARRHPALAARDEAVLVGRAVELDADGFRAVVKHWRACAESVESPDPQAEPPAPEPVDELHLSKGLDGRYELSGSFSAGAGALVDAAVGGRVDQYLRARRDGDESVSLSGAQLRANALVDLLSQRMRREPSEQSAPDRYRVVVVARWDELDRLAEAGCDTTLWRVVVGAEGEVLDVGRETRQWPTGIRRAITHRDGGCVFPGCDRPPSWCDIHHCHQWDHGGRTSIDNGALLCRHHHTFIHRKRWRITIENGRPVTRRPDGTQYVITRWSTE